MFLTQVACFLFKQRIKFGDTNLFYLIYIFLFPNTLQNSNSQTNLFCLTHQRTDFSLFVDKRMFIRYLIGLESKNKERRAKNYSDAPNDVLVNQNKWIYWYGIKFLRVTIYI